MIDLTQYYPYLIGIMPALVAFVAGVIRQDKLPALANEIISDVLAIGVAVVQALAGGKLGGSPTSDFALVASYTLAVMHTPAFMQFQKNIQSNVLSLGNGAPAPAPQPTMDVKQLAMAIAQTMDLPALAMLLRDELIKSNGSQRQVVPPRPQAPDMPTTPQLNVVRTPTPPNMTTLNAAASAQTGTVVNWMNSNPSPGNITSAGQLPPQGWPPQPQHGG